MVWKLAPPTTPCQPRRLSTARLLAANVLKPRFCSLFSSSRQQLETEKVRGIRT